jgi:hypothetical protein
VINGLVRQIGGSRGGHGFESLGGLELKGSSEPVQAFELQWELAPKTGIALPERLRELPATAYVGRWRSASGWESCGERRVVVRCALRP